LGEGGSFGEAARSISSHSMRWIILLHVQSHKEESTHAQPRMRAVRIDSPVKQQEGVSARSLAAGSARALRQCDPRFDSRGCRERRVPARTHGSRATKSSGGRTTGTAGRSRRSPRGWVTAYTCSPRRDWACLSPPPQNACAFREGTPAARASGPHAFTVRR
jgi:hypothetical protein